MWRTSKPTPGCLRGERQPGKPCERTTCKLPGASERPDDRPSTQSTSPTSTASSPYMRRNSVRRRVLSGSSGSGETSTFAATQRTDTGMPRTRLTPSSRIVRRRSATSLKKDCASGNPRVTTAPSTPTGRQARMSGFVGALLLITSTILAQRSNSNWRVGPVRVGPGGGAGGEALGFGRAAALELGAERAGSGVDDAADSAGGADCAGIDDRSGLGRADWLGGAGRPGSGAEETRGIGGADTASGGTADLMTEAGGGG